MNDLTTVYINDYDDDIVERLLRLKRGLGRRDEIITEISNRKQEFLMGKKDVIKEFLEERNYYPAKSYDNDRMNETFYCEMNSHHARLYLFDFIHFIVTSGDQYYSYKIDLMVNDREDRFERVSAIDSREGRIAFYGLGDRRVTPEFLDEEIEKLENNLAILEHRIETFDEENLIYKYEDVIGTKLPKILNKVLNETKI